MKLAETDVYNDFVWKAVEVAFENWDLANEIKNSGVVDAIKSAMFECGCQLISDSASDANLQMFGLVHTAKLNYDSSVNAEL